MRFSPQLAEVTPIQQDVVSLPDLARAIMERSAWLDRALDELREASGRAADAGKTYREEKAKAYVRCRGTIPEREANVDQLTSDLWHEAKLAEDLRAAQLEAVRCGRSQLSALQSIANAVKAEMEFARTA